MNQTYTVGNFRKNIKEALDAAITKPVYVMRGRDTYQISLVATDIPNPVQEPRVQGPRVQLCTSQHAQVAAPKPIAAVQPGHKSKPALLVEIRERETLRDEDLEYSQDADTNRSILKAAKEDLDKLWIEYNAL